MSQTPESWKKKVRPAFREIAAMYGALVAARRPPDREKRAREVRQILGLSFQKRRQLFNRHPDNSPGTPWQQVTATGYLPPSPQEKLEQVLDWFFFKRNRTPRWLALEKEKEGNLKAHKQLVRANDEFCRMLNGHGQVPRFKVDQFHTDLLELGLHLGLQVLSSEELADCFEELCICGKFHDADALKKQRSRVLKDLETALQEGLRYRLRRPSWERFAVYGDKGFIAKAYRPRDGSRYVEISRWGKGFECVVEVEGTVTGFREDDSELGYPEVLSHVPRVFFVSSNEQLFKMFFPEG
jgi:hypothetical protein